MICKINYGSENIFALHKEGLKIGDYVIFNVDDGKEIGKIIKIFNGTADDIILRKATESEIEKMKEIEKEELDILKICEEKIKEMVLPLKIASLHIQFDHRKLKIKIAAKEQLNLKQFFNYVSRIFLGKIEITPIGERTYAKQFALYGVCGLPTCCSTFLKEFESISVDDIKEQKLTVRTSKLTGICGKLMCCLAFERKMERNEKRKEK